MTSTKPYLVRAIYQWVIDNDLTPYLSVNPNDDNILVPEELIGDDQIVFNISPSAIINLEIGNEWIHFDARFSGRPFSIAIPTQAVIGIYANENAQGMVFHQENQPAPSEKVSLDTSSEPKSHLKVIK